MPRIRSVKPEFFRKAEIGRLSPMARLLFIGMWTEADDEGRLLGSSKQLAGAIFPFDEEATDRRVEKWIGELVEAKFVLPYHVEGMRYFQIRTWNKHQRINRPSPSKFPSPPSIVQGSLTDYLTEPVSNGSSQIQSGSKEVEVEQGTGSKEQGEHLAPAPPPRDEIFDALVELFGDPPIAKNLRGAWGVAAKELREQGATREEIRARFTRYRLAMPQAACTPNALAKHWGRFAADVPATQDVHPLDAHIARTRMAGGQR